MFTRGRGGDGGGDVLLGSRKPQPIPHLVQLNFSTLYSYQTKPNKASRYFAETAKVVAFFAIKLTHG